MFDNYSFAAHYDKLMDGFEYDGVFLFIDDLFRKIGRGKDVLELGCGTGELTKRLARAFVVDAFDKSEEMLTIAQNKLMTSGVRFFKADVLNFKMHKNYDLIVSATDVLNYILEERDLKNIFKNVREHLKDGGVFIFDLKSEKLYESLPKVQIQEEEDIFMTWENQFDKNSGLNVYSLNFFEADGDYYTRFEEVHTQRAYDRELIKDLLEESGFKNVEIFEGYVKDSKGGQRDVYKGEVWTD